MPAQRRGVGRAPCSIVRVMARSRLFLLALPLLVALAGEACKTAPGWEHAPSSQHLASLDADLLFFDVPPLPRRGPAQLVVLRFNRDMRFVPHHFQNEKLEGPLGIREWAKALNAPVVFNAGQFDEGHQYIGWLLSDGRWLSRRRKPQWQGLLVSDPQTPGLAFTRLVDLNVSSPNTVDHYRNALQSMMLIDEAAHLRVRDTDIAASRTVIAEDARGRLLIVATQGAVTLGDLARWLPESGLNIVRAMNLDGGHESQLALCLPERKLVLLGQYGSQDRALGAHLKVGKTLLPAVVALYPPLPPKEPPPSPAAIK